MHDRVELKNYTINLKIFVVDGTYENYADNNSLLRLTSYGVISIKINQVEHENLSHKIFLTRKFCNLRYYMLKRKKCNCYIQCVVTMLIVLEMDHIKLCTSTTAYCPRYVLRKLFDFSVSIVF